MFQGKYAEADPLSEGATAIQHIYFAVLGTTQGRYEEAEPLYKRSLAIDEKVYGPDHPEVATDLFIWAELLRAQVRSTRAF